MTASSKALSESLSIEQKHELAGLPCEADRAMPSSSLEVSDEAPTMETASDDEPAPLPAPVHVVLTMDQVHAHFDAFMVEEQLAPQPASAFQQAQEEEQ